LNLELQQSVTATIKHKASLEPATQVTNESTVNECLQYRLRTITSIDDESVKKTLTGLTKEWRF